MLGRALQTERRGKEAVPWKNDGASNPRRRLEERLAEEAQRFGEALKKLTPDMAREVLLRRARQAKTEFQIQPSTSRELETPKVRNVSSRDVPTHVEEVAGAVIPLRQADG